MVNPLMAPPVPNKPAENPENAPPTSAFFLLGEKLTFLLIKKNKLKPTKNTPKIISKEALTTYLESKPPTITKTTAGAPMVKSSFLI